MRGCRRRTQDGRAATDGGQDRWCVLLLDASSGHDPVTAPSRRLQHSRVDADYCCSADSGASWMTAARGGGATLWLSAPPHRVAQLARAGFRIAVRMQLCYAARLERL